MSYTFTLKRIWTWKQYICFLDYMYMHWYLEAFCMFSFGWGDDSTWYVSKGLKSQPRCFSSCLTYWMMLHAMLPEMVCLWKGKKYRYSFNSCPFYTFSFSGLVFALDFCKPMIPSRTLTSRQVAQKLLTRTVTPRDPCEGYGTLVGHTRLHDSSCV